MTSRSEVSRMTAGFSRRVKETSTIALTASGTLTEAHELSLLECPAAADRLMREKIVNARNIAALVSRRCESLLSELDAFRREAGQ